MDSITHIAFGAIVGEAIAGKRLGKRAMFLGAIAQSLPDIDFVASFWLSATDNVLVHRGFTHSFLFGVLATVVLAAGSERWHRARAVPLWTWLLFWGSEIFLHLLLDACNAYGIGWFEPFSDVRFSFHILFVADPFFSAPLGIALAALMILDSKKTFARRVWIYTALTISAAYFLYALNNKIRVDKATRAALKSRQIEAERFFSTPTPLNSWLWYIVAETDSGFHAAYRSSLDEKPEMSFNYFPQRDELLAGMNDRRDVQQLKEFSQGYYTVEIRTDTLIFNDLRFGQIAGWADPDGKFVFHYYLNYPEANLMVIQRGRFSNWNEKTFRSMVRRMRGE